MTQLSLTISPLQKLEHRVEARSRVRCKAGVAYDSDPDHAEKVLLESLPGNRGVALDLMIRNVHRACEEVGMEMPDTQNGIVHQTESQGLAITNRGGDSGGKGQ